MKNKENLKIGITCYPTYGGSGVLATELGKLLARRGHEVHFITSSLPYRLRQHFENRVYFHEVEISGYPLFEYAPYDLALAAKQKEIFETEKLDVLHVHYALPHAVSAFLAAKMLSPKKLPIVTTLHGTDITIVGKEKSFFDLTRLGINESTVITAVSNYLSQEATKIFYPERKIQTLHNFVDLDLFQKRDEKSKRQELVPCEEVMYVHVSNFREVKRTLDVIRIFARVYQDLASCLLMVGEGPMLSEARSLVRELGLEEHVRFLGKQEDIVTILNMSDVLLFPSEVESFGLVALEAMACEIPVIASRSGGIPEVVSCGEVGYLSEVGDVERMAQKALKLGQDAELRQKMGKAGRQRAETLFHPDRILTGYEEVYQQAIETCK
jgi:N-acetyl-alpha-D-glucosaminyl L-malate synthase BshA